MHIDDASKSIRWHACAPSKDLSYRDEDFLQSQIPIFRELVALLKQGDLHLSLLVFSGDNDSVCSTSSTQAWIYDLGVDPLPGRDWHEWSIERQTAGFVTKFDLGKRKVAVCFHLRRFMVLVMRQPPIDQLKLWNCSRDI